MKEQSDTPRTDAAAQFVSHFGWQVHADFARALERELATAMRERDEARAEVERLRKATDELYNGTMRQAIRLAATEADRRFFGVGELERTGYIPAGSADEREAKP